MPFAGVVGESRASLPRALAVFLQEQRVHSGADSWRDRGVKATFS